MSSHELREHGTQHYDSWHDEQVKVLACKAADIQGDQHRLQAVEQTDIVPTGIENKETEQAKRLIYRST